MPSIDARLGPRGSGDSEEESGNAVRAASDGTMSAEDIKRLRRKSELPAGTRDPVIRKPSLADTLLILTALDEHLASGFSTTYPEQISKYCDEALWTQFITDINDAAKLKKKDKLVIRIKPAFKNIKILNKVMETRLEKRTKPILNVLKYWQDVLRTYGIHIELRKGGVPVKRKLILPPMAATGLSGSHRLRNRSTLNFADVSKNIRSSWISARTSFHASQESNPSTAANSVDSLPVRPPFANSNHSELSLASNSSFSYGSTNPALEGKWELVVFTGFKRRSEVPSLYSRSRRFSTYSLPQTRDRSRPSSVSMISTEELPSLSVAMRSRATSMSSSRGARSKVLTLEELAKLPLPPSSSPFGERPRRGSAQGSEEVRKDHQRIGSTNSMSDNGSISSAGVPRRPLPSTPQQGPESRPNMHARVKSQQDPVSDDRRLSQRSAAASIGHQRSLSTQSIVVNEFADVYNSRRRSAGAHIIPTVSDSDFREHVPQIHTPAHVARSKAGSVVSLPDLNVGSDSPGLSRTPSALNKTDGLYDDEAAAHDNLETHKPARYTAPLSPTSSGQDQSRLSHSQETGSRGVSQATDVPSQHNLTIREHTVASNPPTMINTKSRRESMATTPKSPLARLSHTPETMMAEENSRKARLSTLMSSATSMFSKSLANLALSLDPKAQSEPEPAPAPRKELPPTPQQPSLRTQQSVSSVRPKSYHSPDRTDSRGRSTTRKEIDFSAEKTGVQIRVSEHTGLIH